MRKGKKEHTFPKVTYRTVSISKHAGENLGLILRRNERAGVCSSTGRHLSSMRKALGPIPDYPLKEAEKRTKAFR